MCGFAGVVWEDSNERPFPKQVLSTMAAPLRHRGPDATGIHWANRCGLAHQRLSIIDLSDAGRQPMSNENGTIWIAYNGETYNFRDLKSRFALDGKHQFRSRTDTEVIVHLYEDLGIDCVRYLDGMYAFAIWDQRNEALHLARDPFGIKPLFYLQTPGAFWFASEIKALLAVPGYEPEPDLEALHHYLAFDYIPGPLTAFRGIQELRPGHRLTIFRGERKPQIARFFDLAYDVDRHMTETDAITRSREMLMQAVERQLVADVPVGVMLSGGMDSSALTALMARVRGQADFHTFSIGFEDKSFDESSFARLVAEHVGTQHHEVQITAPRVLDLLQTYLSHIDEPYADGSAIPTFLLADCASEYVTVLLSGEGGDEFFSGYDTHAAYRWRQKYRRIPGPLRRGVIRRCVDSLPVSEKKLSLEFKAKRFVRGAELDIPRAHFFWRMVLSEDMKRSILAEPGRFRGFGPSDRLFVDRYAQCEAEDPLNRLLYLDASYHLPDDLMIKNDRMTMAHSLEARVPFTDRPLVEFLATVPVDLKLKGTRKKHLLRSAMEGILPQAVLDKKKVGLEMPYSRWLRGEWRDLGEHALAPDRLSATGLFDPKGVQALWDQHQSKRIDHGRALWGLINYMTWYEIYIEKGNHASFQTTPRRERIASDAMP